MGQEDKGEKPETEEVEREGQEGSTEDQSLPAKGLHQQLALKAHTAISALVP